MKLRWRFGILAGIVLLVCGMYPQMKMWYLRGGDWQGHYAYNDIDEVAYASYLRALIDGRPRRNDPYTGRDDTAEHSRKNRFSRYNSPRLTRLRFRLAPSEFPRRRRCGWQAESPRF
jgi:hypothetical protein